MKREKKLSLPYPVVLASGSPRRREILSRYIEDFEIFPADIDEKTFQVEDPWQSVQSIAREKALTVFEQRPESLVLAGDTLVALPDSGGFEILGQPRQSDKAIEMLQKLSGKEHLVISGVAIRNPKGLTVYTETTKVRFRDLNQEEIETYVMTGEPLDKAGAYAIQLGGKDYVLEIKGSYDNIIGLPTEELVEMLRTACK